MVNDRDLQLNSGMRCAKVTLLIVSFMYAITAVLLVMIGTTIQSIFGDFSQFIDGHFFSPPVLLVAIGFILLFVAALGAIGAIKESVMLINLFGVSLFLVCILEISAAIAAFVMQSQVRDMLMRTMWASMEEYANNDYIRTGVDFMQLNLQCCGVNEPADWRGYWSINDNATNNEIDLPGSCCLLFNMDEPSECEIQFQFGCITRMDFIISQSAMLIAIGGITVAMVQLLGVICAFMLAKTLRRNKSIREARRWQMQQSLGVLISGGKMPPPMNSPMTGYTQLDRTERFLEQAPITFNSPSVN